MKLSNEVKDLIFKLCTDAEMRLSADGIKAHSFFMNFDFGSKLRRSSAPYIPIIRNSLDTSNFETCENLSSIDEKDFEKFKALPIKATNTAELNPVDLQDATNAAAQLKLNDKPKESVLNANISSNNMGNNPNGNSYQMLYEFTFRRFFDEVYQPDFLRYYDDSNLSSTNSIYVPNSSSMEANTVLTKNSLFGTAIKETESEQDENEKEGDLNQAIKTSDKGDVKNDFKFGIASPLSPTLTSMMASLTSNTPTITANGNHQQQFFNFQQDTQKQEDLSKLSSTLPHSINTFMKEIQEAQKPNEHEAQMNDDLEQRNEKPILV
jgi:hypothetical protein